MDVAAEGHGVRKMWVPAGVRLALIRLFVALAILWPATLTQAPAQSFSFSNVRIEGNDRVDPATIVAFAGIARATPVTAGGLNDAYQRVVRSGLFETVEFVPQGSTLVIRVQEFPTINIINFEGNRRLKDETLTPLIGSQARRVYSPAQAEADAAIIADAYENAGRFAASVEPRIIRRSGNRVDLVFEVREGGVVEIERLSFVGNRAYSDRRLRQVVNTKQAGFLRQLISRDTFVADRIEFDKQLLRDFYASRGFVDFQILDSTGEITRERDAFFVTFTIREGQSFKVGRVSASSEVSGADAAEFQAALKLRPGVTYSPSVIDTNIARLETLALRKGLDFVRVDPRITRNERNGTVDVDFAVVRGPRVFIERIDIEGNTTTLDAVVRRQFRSVEGDPFNPREIRQAAERIRALGYFANADVDAEPGSAPDQVVVNVDVEEQPTGSLGFGASFGADAGLGFNITFSEQNFLGRGQSVSLNVSTASASRAASFSFGEPAFLGRDLRFGFDIFYNETNNENARFNTRSVGIRPSLSFPVAENLRLGLSYRLEQEELKGVSEDSSFILQTEQDRGAELASGFGLSLTYDTRRSGLNPNGGVLLRFGTEFIGVGGDVNYISTTALALAERRILNEEVTLRAVFEGGAINTLKGDSRVTDRFFGNGKIRGFDANGYGPRDLVSENEDALGGNFFVAARLEAEFPVGIPEEFGIRGGVFFDVGSVWGLDNVNGGPTGTDIVDDEFHLRSSIGVSIFWDTPVSPLRFNLARALQKQPYDEERTFDLTISTQF